MRKCFSFQIRSGENIVGKNKGGMTQWEKNTVGITQWEKIQWERHSGETTQCEKPSVKNTVPQWEKLKTQREKCVGKIF